MHRHKRLLVLAALAVAALTVLGAAGCGSSSGSSAASPTPSPSLTPQVVPSVSTGTILEAAKAGDLNSFLGAVALVGLQKTLDQKIPFTVFAPNDAAFKSIGIDELMKNVPKLKSIVSYHIVPTENLKPADITNGEKAMSYDLSLIHI